VPARRVRLLRLERRAVVPEDYFVAVPERVAICGLPPPLSLHTHLRSARRSETGLYSTVMVQLAPRLAMMAIVGRIETGPVVAMH